MAEDSTKNPLFADYDRETDRSLEACGGSLSAVGELARDFEASHNSASTSVAARTWDSQNTCVFGQSAPDSDATGWVGDDFQTVQVPLPAPGDQVGGFRLVAELGRGAFARVYLAEEANLGGRHVALKVSAAEGDEPQILARLQHSHIVPVYSVRDDPQTGLRLLCMPYLGGANLATLLEESQGGRTPSERPGSLVRALDLISQRLPAASPATRVLNRRSIPHPSPSRIGSWLRLDPPETASRSLGAKGGPDRPSRRFAPLRWVLERPIVPEADPSDDGDELLPSRRFLCRADRVRTAVWVVARLAEGLGHAHARGLLHRDLKPSNVLIAGDGTPMLLDFNLSVEAPTEETAAESIAKATLGGTLPYMAPEHLDALDPQGSTLPSAVDERSDLYSLGLILFEMIAGEPAFKTPSGPGGQLDLVRRMVAERRGPAPSLRARGVVVPPSLDALASKCLDPNPDRRHATACELAEDLRRFLDDLPMKHGPEPSLRERVGKWVRRHPAVFSSSSTAMAALVVIGFVLLVAFQISAATEALYVRLKLRKFQGDALETRFLLNTTSDAHRVRRGLVLASATLREAGVDEKERSYGGAWIDRLDQTERDEVRREILGLLLEHAHAGVVLASRDGDDTQRREALESAVSRLDGLESNLAAPPSILFRQRSRYRAALGDAEGAEVDRRAAEARPPVLASEWTALGSFQLAGGDPAAAEVSLNRAVTLDVTSFWAWFALGHCHFEQGRFPEAVADFTACVVARPDFVWGYFNRGLALDRAGRTREALNSYDRALTLDPDFLEARVNRGLVELALDLPDLAEADLRMAIRAGRRDPVLAAALGDALTRQGKGAEAERMLTERLARNPAPELRSARGVVRLRTDLAGAAEDFRFVLASNPDQPVALLGMARILREEDRASAIAYLNQAIQADPGFFEAVELRAVDRAKLGDRTALDDVARLLENPTASRLYNAACALALLGESARASEALGRAVVAGFPADYAVADADLASLHGRLDFKAALERRGAR